jgi:hypothetical protein
MIGHFAAENRHSPLKNEIDFKTQHLTQPATHFTSLYAMIQSAMRASLLDTIESKDE